MGQSTRAVRRVAMLSVHTSPLDAPGAGDAGGMNVYIVETAKRLAARGVEVEIFTRATASEQPPLQPLCPGVSVRHVTAGPFEGLAKADLPPQLCAFTAGVLRAEVRHDPGWYDVIHSHYWLSGQVGWLARERWGVPLVHSAHTLAKVKNALLADGDEPEPRSRVIGEEQVVAEADRLIASTADEAGQLLDLYGADPRRVRTIAPGVDLDVFTPGPAAAARQRLGLRPDALTLLFVGRIQPLKAPDVLLRAAALLAEDPGPRRPVAGGRARRAERLGPQPAPAPGDPARRTRPRAHRAVRPARGPCRRRRLLPRRRHHRGAELQRVLRPGSRSSRRRAARRSSPRPSAGCRPPSPTTCPACSWTGTIRRSGRRCWATSLGTPRLRRRLAAGARPHAELFSWDRTADGLMRTYGEAMNEFAADRELAIRR